MALFETGGQIKLNFPLHPRFGLNLLMILSFYHAYDHPGICTDGALRAVTARKSLISNSGFIMLRQSFIWKIISMMSLQSRKLQFLVNLTNGLISRPTD